MVLDNVLCVQLNILELLEGKPIVLVAVVSAAGLVLEPHCLIVVNAHIVAAVLYKDIHDA